MPNHLIHETSPYLLQHAHNPVDWYPWNEEAWEKAKREDKLVLVSIGYSSCHWCHVMERETFEDEESAKLMNDHFVCIKVDREERPDVDQVYMTAVQLMTRGGGWPLNCFCLPDGRPLYGGTYFPKAAWQEVLTRLFEFYAKNKSQAERYAEELSHGVRQTEQVVKRNEVPSFSKNDLKEMVKRWGKQFDYKEGGPDRAPKFPMPNNYEFLLHYAVANRDDALKDYVMLTLDKMAFGGIYDHVGGGFARYSTDALWKVPHFEKMLYDNAQLVGLYAHAYQLTRKELYKNVVHETLEFIEREMTSPEGGFYSALDADSEGVEGKYYVWKKEELDKFKVQGLKFKGFPTGEIFDEYYNVNSNGYWEDGNHILLRRKTDEQIAEQFSISADELRAMISQYRNLLLEERNKRVRPGLDNKILTSWNALMIKGYCDAYMAFGERKFLDSAIKASELIIKYALSEDGSLIHSLISPELQTSDLKPFDKLRAGSQTPPGFLEDYSFFSIALIHLYQCTFREEYLHLSKRITDYALKHFYDNESGMFWFTSDTSHSLFVRKKEIHDNVIPSSNSCIARTLFLLGKYFDDKKYLEISSAMLNNVQSDMKKYPSSYSNWAALMLWKAEPFFEIAITGAKALNLRKEFSTHYLPHNILAGDTDGHSTIPLLQNRFKSDSTLIYVCRNYTCQLPVDNVPAALRMFRIDH